MEIYFSFFYAGFLALFFYTLIYVKRDAIVFRGGVSLLFIMMVATTFWLVPSIAWIFPKLPIFESGSVAFLKFDGVTFYGLDLDRFPLVLTGYLAFCVITVGFCIFLPRGPKGYARGRFMEAVRFLRSVENRYGTRIYASMAVVCAGALFLTIVALGPSRFWMSEFGRFDATGSSMIIRFYSLFRLVLLILGLVSSIALISSKYTGWKIVTVLLSLPMFIVNESRVFAVILILAVFILWVRMKWGYRLLTLPFFIYASLAIYIYPLHARGVPGTGMGYFFRDMLYSATPEVVFSGDRIFSLATNLGVGFGNTTQTVTDVLDDRVEIGNKPMGYKLLMLSPLPSIIDRFGYRWERYKGKINAYTPRNTPSELILTYGWGGVLFVPMVYWFYYFLFRSYARKGLRYDLICMVGVACFAIGTIYATQYNPRVVSRMWIFGLFLVILISKFVEMRSPQRRRID